MQSRVPDQARGRRRFTTLTAPILQAPETWVALFAFLLNFPWEFWQLPFFTSPAAHLRWEEIKRCSQAVVGDAVIAVVAFWVVAAWRRSREWILRPTRAEVIAFLAIGVLVTFVIERLATGVFGWWAYAESMPVIPLVGVGLLPLLQWVLILPLVVWFVRRQLT